MAIDSITLTNGGFDLTWLQAVSSYDYDWSATDINSETASIPDFSHIQNATLSFEAQQDNNLLGAGSSVTVSAIDGDTITADLEMENNGSNDWSGSIADLFHSDDIDAGEIRNGIRWSFSCDSGNRSWNLVDVSIAITYELPFFTIQCPDVEGGSFATVVGDVDTTVTIIAVPHDGYEFVGWSDNSSITTLSRSIPLTSAMSNAHNTTLTYTPIFKRSGFNLYIGGKKAIKVFVGPKEATGLFLGQQQL